MKLVNETVENITSFLGWSPWDYRINGYDVGDLWIILVSILLLLVPFMGLIRFYARRPVSA